MHDPSLPTPSSSPEHIAGEISALRNEAKQLRELMDRLSAFQTRSSETTRKLLGVLDTVVRQQQDQTGADVDQARMEELIRRTVNQEVRTILDARAEAGDTAAATRRRLPRLQPWVNVGLILLLLLSAAAGYWLVVRWPDPFALSSSNLTAHDGLPTMEPGDQAEPSDRPLSGSQSEPDKSPSTEQPVRDQMSLPLPSGLPEPEGARSSASAGMPRSGAEMQMGTAQGTSVSPGASSRQPLLIRTE